MCKEEVGWSHAGKQIRTPRKLNLPKSCKKGEILEEINPFFFLEGKSPMGPMEGFDFSVADFLQRDIDDKSINDLRRIKDDYPSIIPYDLKETERWGRFCSR